MDFIFICEVFKNKVLVKISEFTVIHPWLFVLQEYFNTRTFEILTSLSQMEFSTLINWTSPFPLLGLLGSIFIPPPVRSILGGYIVFNAYPHFAFFFQIFNISYFHSYITHRVIFHQSFLINYLIKDFEIFNKFVFSLKVLQHLMATAGGM